MFDSLPIPRVYTIGLAIFLAVRLGGCGYGLRSYRYDNPMVREQQGEKLFLHVPESKARDRLMASVGPRVGFLACGNPDQGFDPVTEPYGNGRAAAITSDGYYLTAFHVVDEEACYLVETEFKGEVGAGPISEEDFERLVSVEVFAGRIVWSSRRLDLAIVKFPKRSRQYFRNLEWEPEVGSIIYTADDSGRGTVIPEEGMNSMVGNGAFETAGKVTSVKPASGRTEGRTIRADLLSRGGMSGAPVVTEDGDLCGIIVRLEGSPLVDGSLRTVARMISPEQIERLIAADRAR